MDIDWTAIRIDGQKEFSIDSASTTAPLLYDGRKDYKNKLEDLRDAIDDYQRIMYAHNRYSVLAAFQAMDAAGKDSTIRAVFSGVNPHGVQVTSFKHPTDQELDHNYLWRTTVAMPPRGHIGVFNRSYYEEVLICRVHPEIVTEHQKLPGEAVRDIDSLFEDRYQAIRAFERYAADNGTVILKFFLHLSYEEQRERFLSRIDNREKNWKFSAGDIRERGYWADYQQAYEDAINETSSAIAPWYVIPADDKPNMRLIVAHAVLDALKSMDMDYPDLPAEQLSALASHREQLLRD